MSTYSSVSRFQQLLRFFGVLLWSSVPVHVLSQEMKPPGVRYTYDEINQVVAISYYGSIGLRKSAPENVSHVEAIDIAYQTTLTAEDVSFLSSLANVEELLIGGNLSDEFVEIEGSLVSGRLKPASKGRFKTSHYES